MVKHGNMVEAWRHFQCDVKASRRGFFVIIKHGDMAMCNVEARRHGYVL